MKPNSSSHVRACFLADIEAREDLVAAEIAGALLEAIDPWFVFLDRSELPRAQHQALAGLYPIYARWILAGAHVETDHPAQQLLERMAAMAVPQGNDPDGNTDRWLLVSQIIHELENGGNEAFSEPRIKDCLTRLERLHRRTARRAELAARRAAEAERAQKRLSEARDQAQELLQRVRAGRELSSAITAFLEGPWHNLLTLECVRHGVASEQVHGAVELVQRLAGSDPATQAPDPSLQADLAARLALVGYREDEGMQAVMELFQPEADPEPPTPTGTPRTMPAEDRLPSAAKSQRSGPSPAPAPAAKPVERDRGAEATAMAAANDGPESGSPWHDHADLADQLVPGSWIEFSTDEGHTVLGKLSWKHPVTRKLLFVDPQGRKLADWDLQDMVEELVRGEARLVESQRA